MAAGTYLGASAGAAAAPPPLPTACAERVDDGLDVARRIGGRRSNSFFSRETRRNFSRADAVVDFQQSFLVQGGDMLDGDFDAIDGAENAAAEFFEPVGKFLDLLGGGGKQRVESIAEGGIVRRERGQHSGVIDRLAERRFQLPNPRNDAGIHERAEVLEAIRLVEQGAEFAQQLHVASGEHGYFRLGQNFQQRNFKRRQRNRAVEAIAAPLPLAGDPGMAKQKSCDQIGFVAIGAGIVAMAREVPQQRLGNLGIKVGLHSEPQHGGSDRHVEKLDPELHLIERGAHVVGVADDVGSEFGGSRQLSAELVAQQTLVKALHGGQQSQFPFGILNQSQLLRDRAVVCPNGDPSF